MKNLFYIFISFLLLSCSNDDDNSSVDPIHNPSFSVDFLLNRWSFDKVTLNGTSFEYQNQPNCLKDGFAFLNNPGQLRQYEEQIFINEDCSANNLNLEWKINEDTISFFFGTQFVLDYKVILLTQDKFVYSYYADINNDNIKDTVTVEAVPYY